jgi:hypothetical protein
VNCNIKDFKSSSGWLDGWKKRNNISFKTVVGEGGLVDPKVIENYRKLVLPSLLKDFDSRDVFNADETALFFKAMPNKTMYYKNMPANSLERNCLSRTTFLTSRFFVIKKFDCSSKSSFLNKVFVI